MFGNFSSGGNNSSEWKDRGSNNRHCKTLSRILSESNNVYFSSVTTTAETEEVTKGGEPPLLRATDSPLLSANDDGASFSRTSHNQTMIRGILRRNASLLGHSTPPPRRCSASREPTAYEPPRASPQRARVQVQERRPNRRAARNPPCQIREATTAAEGDRRRAILMTTRGRKISQKGEKKGTKQQNQNQQQQPTVKRGMPIHHASPVDRSTAPATTRFNRAKLAEAKMKRRKLRTSKSSET